MEELTDELMKAGAHAAAATKAEAGLCSHLVYTQAGYHNAVQITACQRSALRTCKQALIHCLPS